MPSIKFVGQVIAGSVRALTKTGFNATKNRLTEDLAPVFQAQRQQANLTVRAADAFHGPRDMKSRVQTGAKKAVRSFMDRGSRDTDRYGNHTYRFDDKPVLELLLTPGRKLVNRAGLAIENGVSDTKRALTALRRAKNRSPQKNALATMPAPSPEQEAPVTMGLTLPPAPGSEPATTVAVPTNTTSLTSVSTAAVGQPVGQLSSTGIDALNSLLYGGGLDAGRVLLEEIEKARRLKSTL